MRTQTYLFFLNLISLYHYLYNFYTYNPSVLFPKKSAFLQYCSFKIHCFPLQVCKASLVSPSLVLQSPTFLILSSACAEALLSGLMLWPPWGTLGKEFTCIRGNAWLLPLSNFRQLASLLSSVALSYATVAPRHLFVYLGSQYSLVHFSVHVLSTTLPSQ